MAGRRSEAKERAKAALEHAHRGDRPIETAVGRRSDLDPTRKTAQQLLELVHKGGADPKQISAALARHTDEREADGDRVTPSERSALATSLIDDVAGQVDDHFEAARTEDRGHADDRDPNGYEDDRDDDYHEDDDEAEFDTWIRDTYPQVADQLDQVAEDDQQRMLDVLNDLYDLHLDGHDTETAERLYQEQVAGQGAQTQGTGVEE